MLVDEGCKESVEWKPCPFVACYPHEVVEEGGM